MDVRRARAVDVQRGFCLRIGFVVIVEILVNACLCTHFVCVSCVYIVKLGCFCQISVKNAIKLLDSVFVNYLYSRKRKK